MDEVRRFLHDRLGAFGRQCFQNKFDENATKARRGFRSGMDGDLSKRHKHGRDPFVFVFVSPNPMSRKTHIVYDIFAGNRRFRMSADVRRGECLVRGESAWCIVRGESA